MAVRDEIRAQRKKLKGKGIRAHLQWFWDYEKLPTLIVAGAAALVTALIVQWTTYRPYVFGVLFVNVSWQSEEQMASDPEELASSFMDYAGIDPGESRVLTDLTEQLSLGGATSQTALATQEKVTAELAANQIDVAVMDYAQFQSYLSSELFGDLRETIDEETLEQYSGRIYYVDRKDLIAMESAEDAEGNAVGDAEEPAASGAADGSAWDAWAQQKEQEAEAREALSSFVLPDPSGMEDPVPVGIQVNDAPWILSHHYYDETAALFGVVSAGSHPETCQQFLEYLFEK